MAGFKALKGQGHSPTLFAAFIYFDMSFMIWMILGSLSSEIVESFAIAGFIMTTGQKATLLSLPIFSGALLRIVLGFSVDKFGPKKTALVSQFIVILALLLQWLFHRQGSCIRQNFRDWFLVLQKCMVGSQCFL